MKPWVCVASGPSLTLAQIRHIGIARANDKCRVLAVNDCMYPCWFADIGYGSDVPFWDAHHGMPNFHGKKYSIAPASNVQPKHKDVILLQRDPGNNGISEKENHVSTGGNSGHAALCLLYNLGVKTIYLVGYDFQGCEKGMAMNHWFGEHPGKLKRGGAGQLPNRIKALQVLTKQMQERGCKIYNATISSGIDWLPKADISTLSSGVLDV